LRLSLGSTIFLKSTFPQTEFCPGRVKALAGVRASARPGAPL
jgi:hypothetical protein